MPRYFSLHTIACLTRQQLNQLVEDLRRDETVTCVRFVADTVEGRLLCEFDAPNRELVEAFLTIHSMHPHWILRAENEWR
jgi:hypothetical protein